MTSGVLVVDTHTHYVPPSYRAALLHQAVRDPAFAAQHRLRLRSATAAGEPANRADQRLEDMAVAGIDHCLVALPPPAANFGPAAHAAAVARAANDELLGLAAASGGRLSVLSLAAAAVRGGRPCRARPGGRRFPRVRRAGAHHGRRAGLCRGDAEHELAHYLRERVHLDTCSYHPPAVRCSVDTVGADRLVLGSDYPFRGPQRRAVDDVLGCLDEPEVVQAVLGGTAAGLFRGVPARTAPETT